MKSKTFSGTSTPRYDNMGQVATVKDAENRTTAYGYNLLGARNSLTFSDAGVQTVNTFDGAGRPLEITSPAGRKQNLTYSFLGNVSQVQFKNSGGTVTETQAMTYDAYGRETATSSSQYAASTAKSYNDRGQLATESTTYSGRTYTVTYHYDAQGRPSKLTYPSGREAEYTYDDRQLLKTIKWETAQIEDRSYNDAGMLIGVDRAFVDETRTYNAGSQLTQINNTNVGSQTYTYDLNGNVTSETLSGNMANYSFSTIHAGGPFADGYDAEDRFMRFKRSGVTEDILLTRSNIGNISNVNRNGTNTARGYNTAHGLTTVSGGTTQTYDTDGNTTTLHTNVSAAWDDAGRMKNTNVPAGATAGIVGLNENGYVGGNRIWKKITRSGSVVEHRVHIHAGPNLVAEYNAGVAASTPVQEYVYAGEIDSLVAIRRSNGTKYGVTRNRQWSITALHDLANGTIVERYAYEITGRRTIYAANGTTVRTTSTYGNPFGYTNRWHDEDSGLMYFRARYYNPLTGEFLSRDPMEFVDGMSLYRGYFGVNGVDPTGEIMTQWGRKGGVSLEVYEVLGGGIKVDWDSYTQCCPGVKVVPPLYQDVTRTTVTVEGGIGLGVKGSIGGVGIGFMFKLVTARIQFEQVCPSTCYLPGVTFPLPTCCATCFDFSVVPMGVTIDIGLVGGSMSCKFRAIGGIRACFFSAGCPTPGWDWDFCGRIELDCKLKGAFGGFIKLDLTELAPELKGNCTRLFY